MIREEQFSQPGFIDIFDELIAAQHFFGIAAAARDAGREEEASNFDAICTRHWQRAGWIVETRLVAARAAANNPPAESPPEAESGSAAQKETPTEAPVTDTPAAILPEVWPVLRARHCS